MTDQATKQDVQRLHDKIDSLLVTATATKTKLDLMHETPCKLLDGHLDDHKNTKRTWQESVSASVCDLFKVAIAGVVTWFIFWKK
jgi:hypothetical protein